ncbi:MAG: hypothetical protein P4L40_13190 [Terracidiphilus sp.]|nr:hypothetical protein [Terracidiphilus sp.]
MLNEPDILDAALQRGKASPIRWPFVVWPLPGGEVRAAEAIAVPDRYDPIVLLAKARALRIAAVSAPPALQEAYYSDAAEYEDLVQRSLETTIISLAG